MVTSLLFLWFHSVVKSISALKYCLVILFMCVLSESVKKSVRECAVCEASMGAFDELIQDPTLQKDAEQLLKKVCPKFPAQEQAEVQSFSNMKCLSA